MHACLAECTHVHTNKYTHYVHKTMNSIHVCHSYALLALKYFNVQKTSIHTNKDHLLPLSFCSTFVNFFGVFSGFFLILFGCVSAEALGSNYVVRVAKVGCMCVCMCVCMYVCMYVCMQRLCEVTRS